MNEQNEKIWKRCGWHWEQNEVALGLFEPVLLAPNEGLIEGHIGYVPAHLPDLTLDNLFKYAVPELKRVFIDTNYDYLGKKRNKIRIMSKSGSFYDGQDEDTATALCIALENLIDKEGKDE